MYSPVVCIWHYCMYTCMYVYNIKTMPLAGIIVGEHKLIRVSFCHPTSFSSKCVQCDMKETALQADMKALQHQTAERDFWYIAASG